MFIYLELGTYFHIGTCPIKEDNCNCHRARTRELHNWPFHLPDSTYKSNLTSNKQKRTNVLKSSPRIFCMLLHACKRPCEHSALETTITMVFLLNLFWTHSELITAESVTPYDPRKELTRKIIAARMYLHLITASRVKLTWHSRWTSSLCLLMSQTSTS
jgi:hypothetical protein